MSPDILVILQAQNLTLCLQMVMADNKVKKWVAAAWQQPSLGMSACKNLDFWLDTDQILSRLLIRNIPIMLIQPCWESKTESKRQDR